MSYLFLDHIETDPQLMKLLPSDLACRYHALPVATDGSHITIAMAAPDDSSASIAIASALGAPTCFVQADQQEIDQRLAEIWLPKPASRLCVVCSAPTASSAQNLQAYSRKVAELLAADLELTSIPWTDLKSFAKLNHTIEQTHPDFLMAQPTNITRLKRMRDNSTILKGAERIPTSALIAQNPRWPLRKIMLVLPDGAAANNTAVDWTIQFACASEAAVTVLPLLPPVAGIYQPFIQHSTQSLLAANDPMGQQMRLIAQRLADHAIQGAFKLRDGIPLDQLRQEIYATNPDLVIIADDSCHGLQRWMAGELIAPLLGWANRPVFIAKNRLMLAAPGKLQYPTWVPVHTTMSQLPGNSTLEPGYS